MGYAVRKLRNAAVMSSIRWRPRHKVWVPGSPPDLRARKPPPWAMGQLFAGEEAADLGDGANHLAQRRRLLGRWLTGLEDAMTAFHWSSSKATVQGRSGVARPNQIR